MNSLFKRHGLKIAICLWVISLALPTYVSDKGEVTYGIGIFSMGLISLFVPIFAAVAPFHILVWFSNVVLFWSVFKLTAPKSLKIIDLSRRFLVYALSVNLVFGFTYGWPIAGRGGTFLGLLSNLGYWFWIAAFAAALWTAILAKPHQNPPPSELKNIE